jgi:NDP-sugar pyrophosphorylase family protein
MRELQFTRLTPVKAMILAAGFGTRLWPLTEDRTKPAIPFLNRPLIAYSVDYLKSFGLTDIIVNLHHHPDSIRNALGDGSDFEVGIEYSYEEEILGTSGALDRVREKLLDDDFVVLNGKLVTNIDLNAAIRHHREQQALATLVLRVNARRERFSIVEIDHRGWVRGFGGFPQPTAEGPAIERIQAPETSPVPLMFTGIQVLSPRIFEFIPRGRVSHSVSDVYPRAIEAGEAVIGHVSDGDWFEMSTLDRYLEASLFFMRKKQLAIFTGDGCVIEDGAEVSDCVLWNRVTVERGARLRRVVLADDVRIAAGSVIESAVVVRRSKVVSVERGVVEGENLIVAL